MRTRITKLRESRRASWWCTFVLLAALGLCWSLATPPLGAPDERDHAVNAVAVARGQLLGDELTPEQARSIIPGRGTRTAYRAVKAPAIYDRSNAYCFAFQRQVSAACLHFTGSDRLTEVLIPVSLYPPAYYATVGLAARPFPSGPAALYVMRFVTVVLMAALLSSAVASLRRSPSSRLRMLAFLTSLTPMVLFLNASVNPSGPEVAAALALWASGAVLVQEGGAGESIDGRLVTRVGIAATVLALSRQDAPLWLGLILITLGLVAGRSALRSLWTSRRFRLWAAVVVVCTAAQTAWVIGVGTLAAEHSVFPPGELETSKALREAVGSSFAWYRQMIGWFGWLDTPSPALTVLIWTLVLGGLVLIAVTFGRTRWVVAAGAVLAGTFLIPVVLDFAQARGFNAGHWQGRYALPLAVGIPILSALAIERHDLAGRISGGLLPIVGAAALGGAQFLAFGQNLRRYTVGYDSDVWFFLHPAWSPPIGAFALLAGFGVALVATIVWLLTGNRRLLSDPAAARADSAATPDPDGVKMVSASIGPQATMES